MLLQQVAINKIYLGWFQNHPTSAASTCAERLVATGAARPGTLAVNDLATTRPPLQGDGFHAIILGPLLDDRHFAFQGDGAIRVINHLDQVSAPPAGPAVVRNLFCASSIQQPRQVPGLSVFGHLAGWVTGKGVRGAICRISGSSSLHAGPAGLVQHLCKPDRLRRADHLIAHC